jgi:hypothetical protein
VADLIVIGYDPPLAEGATSGMLWGRSSACCSSFRSSGLPSVQGSAPLFGAIEKAGIDRRFRRQDHARQGH